jgi:GPH family glycoside/pentoside/hexuronide:cation symporter
MMMMIYTGINIPYSALMGVVSSSPIQRTSFSQYRFVFAFIGAFIVQGIMLPMVNSFGSDDTSVIRSEVKNMNIMITEKGTGTIKMEVKANIEGEKQEKIKNINVSVVNQEEYSKVDTGGNIIYLKKGFDTYNLSTRDLFPVEYSGIQSISVNNINERKGFSLAMTIMAIMAVIMFLITFLTTKERVQPPPQQKISLKNDIKDLLANKPWWILFALGIFTLSHVSIRNGAIMYYFKYYVGSDALASTFMISGTVATIASIMLTEYFSRIIGKKKLYILSMSLTTIFVLLFGLLGQEDIYLMFILQILVSFAFGPTAPLVFAMYTDAADYSEYITGRRATGLVMSASTMAQKFGWTIGGALAGWLLAFFGFKANFIQQNETLTGIRLMMSVIPAIGSLLGALLMIFYKLDDNYMKTIEKELVLRRNNTVI